MHNILDLFLVLGLDDLLLGGGIVLASVLGSTIPKFFGKSGETASESSKKLLQMGEDRTQNTNAFGETLAQSSTDGNNDGIDTGEDNLLASTNNNSDMFDIRDITENDEDKAKLGTRRTYDRIGQYMQFRCGGRKKKDLGGIGAREKARQNALKGSTFGDVFGDVFGDLMKTGTSIGAGILGSRISGNIGKNVPQQPVEVRNLQNVLDDVNKTRDNPLLMSLNNYLARCGGRYKFRCK